ncbi:hypothetical protein Bbelb_416040 [Branchiostoma belcheri]|nr:hypothetical protein Bbelb_416040 [Branchiostoma belcheri]
MRLKCRTDKVQGTLTKCTAMAERYTASFGAYKAAMEVSLDNYYQFYGSNVPDTVLCEPGAAVRVLGIGSGSGEIDIVILKKLLQRHHSVYSRVVEPSEDMIGRYKVRITYATVTTRRTCFCVLSTCKNVGKRRASVHGTYNSLTTCAKYDTRNRSRPDLACRPHSYTLRNRASDVRVTNGDATPSPRFQKKRSKRNLPQNALVREDASLGAVEFDWCQQTVEEYFTTEEDTKFHLIHAIHVLYYVEDLHATLRNMWEQLADGGYMFIAMQSDKSGLGKLGHKLKDAFVQGDPLNTPFCLSGDVKQWLDAMTISYVTSEDENYHINVTECLKEDSETGSLLLDILT